MLAVVKVFVEKEVKEVALPCHIDHMEMAGKKVENVREIDGVVGWEV